MVHDLKFESHPGKLLEEHIRGVQKGTLLRSALPIAEVAALFHDLGKINPNFQNKLYGKSNGYANHSYLSVIGWVNYALVNMKDIMNNQGLKNQEELSLFILQIAVLIGKHHQNLPNFDKVFIGSEELIRATEFAKENGRNLPMNEFLNKTLKLDCASFELKWGKQENMFVSFLSKYQKKAWKQSPLKSFMDTQEAFAALVESDKRDAGKNKDFFFDENIEKNTIQLSENLELTFDKFEKSPNNSKLNILRTQIRLQAVERIKSKLTTDERVFTLTAPTGAGKTFTMLSVANEIRKQKGNLGIIYSLPFLSITEQVQKIAEELLDDVLSVNSKTENERIKKAQQSYENDQSNNNLKEILKEDFIHNTFDHPFVITTFIQFFETLLSNRNSTLLKLPNFKNRIFLIDEVQALPPRLYIFFSAWLDEFCRRNNSFAILSTATMPKLAIPIKDTDEDCRADLLFQDYSVPNELIDCKKYFAEDIFNRYQIEVLSDQQTNESLVNHILELDRSCLVILNTIADTKKLYNELKGKSVNILLLNTHFIPDDRTRIIEQAQNLLKVNKKVILISTQLIEAGVDIDFPVVYRDMCPLPSLIQSAGRCNRNNNLDKGQVYFFELVSDNGRSRARLIYRDEGKKFLDFCRKEIPASINENELFEVQSKFFESIRQNLTIGEFKSIENTEKSYNMIKCINNAEFENLGKFKLINNNIGEQVQYYILENEADSCYERLNELLTELKTQEDYANTKRIKIKISDFIKQLSGRILNIRVNQYNKAQMPQQYLADIMDIKFITMDNYSSTEGLILDNIENCFL
ncbi:CRISPR-associated helicase Cas3' [Labilibaculum sp.]|uniref:CRISPR-associated helicase Cas3' n=1 Tax=Labilibaculum sp. TaxID=2060723 RepID=UPI002AA6E4BB|nr:CRISPR-associated helicase Cas3' [Labilibaculum sp.]